MLRRWGQSAGKAPRLSSTLEPGEWRVMRLGGAQPRSGMEAEGGMNHVGRKRQQKAVNGQWRMEERRWRGRFWSGDQCWASSHPGQGHGATLPVGHHIVITWSHALGLSGGQNSPSSRGITWRLVGMQKLRPTPDLLSQNLHFHKIPRGIQRHTEVWGLI